MRCDDYLENRTGHYDYRSVRYRAAGEFIVYVAARHDISLDDITVFDIGAGFTEFDYCLRTDFDFRGRYIPIDGSIDGTDLENWEPFRQAHFFVGLEIIEHLHNWNDLVEKMQENATLGVCLSTPNPLTTDVLGMDETHVCEVHHEELEAYDFTVDEETFYGGVFSAGRPDSLFATWEANPR